MRAAGLSKKKTQDTANLYDRAKSNTRSTQYAVIKGKPTPPNHS